MVIQINSSSLYHLPVHLKLPIFLRDVAAGAVILQEAGDLVLDP
jgi:hypothetical protein